MASECVLSTNLSAWPVRRGKVRDVYDLGEQVLLVATDRISAYDWVLPTAIPDKGRVLTQTSVFWFDRLNTQHHLLTADVSRMGLPADVDDQQLAGRSMLCRKTQVVPFECVVRGYLSGSAWKEYQATGAVCGIALPAGFRESERLPAPIFTPATKAESGHDENVPFERMAADLGAPLASELRARSIDLYQQGAQHAAQCGILIADTKFEFGQADGALILIDEVMTPDSSRFWPADQYEPGKPQPSFDKQYVRDWLSSTDWDKN
ncbi:MAG: phosphoribosylaminoimidazolesuccinocarboxamide synthase, partial [Planctomycetales bacterium]|nr:phosphoribosylaminoimidazolesuccinocarboxamide synthase [Planctomycetales bacterium]